MFLLIEKGPHTLLSLFVILNTFSPTAPPSARHATPQLETSPRVRYIRTRAGTSTKARIRGAEVLVSLYISQQLVHYYSAARSTRHACGATSCSGRGWRRSM